MLYKGRIGNTVINHVSASLHAHMADKRKVEFDEFIKFDMRKFNGTSVDDALYSVKESLRIYTRSWNDDRHPDTYNWMPYITFENVVVDRNDDILIVSFKTRYYWKNENGERITTL